MVLSDVGEVGPTRGNVESEPSGGRKLAMQRGAVPSGQQEQLVPRRGKGKDALRVKQREPGMGGSGEEGEDMLLVQGGPGPSGTGSLAGFDTGE